MQEEVDAHNLYRSNLADLKRMHDGKDIMETEEVKVKTIKIRASSIDLACRCTASQLGDEASYGNEWSTFGSACHAAAADKGKTGTYNPEHIAKVYGLTEREMRYMSFLVGSIEMNYPDGTIIERQMQRSVRFNSKTELVVTGKPDVVIPSSDSSPCVVIDYKFGRGDVSADTKQTVTYIWLHTGGESPGTSIVVQPALPDPVKEMHYPLHEVQQHGALLKELAAKISEREEDFCRGSHCDKMYCPRRTSCPAYMSDMKLICNSLITKGEAELTTYKPDMLAKMWAMKSNVDYAFRRVRDMIEIELSKNGTIEAGSECLMKVLEDREVVDPSKAIPILNMLLGDTLTASVLSITKADVEEACSKMYQQTKQKGIQKKVMDALRAAGAMEKIQRPELRFVKKSKAKQL